VPSSHGREEKERALVERGIGAEKFNVAKQRGLYLKSLAAQVGKNKGTSGKKSQKDRVEGRG